MQPIVVINMFHFLASLTRVSLFLSCSGAVGARLSADASTIRSLVGDVLALIVQNTATVLAGLAIAFAANWILALIILVLLPLIGLQWFFQNKFYKGFSANAKVSLKNKINPSYNI